MRIAFYRTNARWLLTALVLTFASSFGQTFFISLFAGGIRAEFGLSDGAWGGLYTLATLASAAVLVQIGRLADTVGLMTLTLGVGAVYVAAAATMALAPSVWLLGLGVFGLRICGQGMMGHLALTAVARWFRANRGKAVAVAVLGYPLGEALLPPLAVLAISAFGWRAGWGIVAGVLALAILPLLVALMMQGSRVPAGEGDGDTAPGMEGRQWTRREVLGHWSFWALMPGVLAPSFIGTVAFFHQVHVSEVREWSLVTMAAGYPVYAAVSVATSLMAGGLVDRVGPVRLLPVYLLPLALAISALTLEGGEWVWLLTLLGIGVSQGVVVTITGALWPTLYGTRHIGSVKALAASAMVVSTAIGPGITGLLIDRGLTLPEQAPAMAAWCVAVSVLFWRVAPRLSARLG